MSILYKLGKFLGLIKPNFYNCKCRPVTKEAEKAMLAKLKEWGYCPVCAKTQIFSLKQNDN